MGPLINRLCSSLHIGGTMTAASNSANTPVALVTGGSRGIGRATALALAEAGVDVVTTYRSSENKAREVVAEIEQRGRRGSTLHLDTADIDSFDGFVDALRAELPGGTLAILVNNAGTGT